MPNNARWVASHRDQCDVCHSVGPTAVAETGLPNGAGIVAICATCLCLALEAATPWKWVNQLMQFRATYIARLETAKLRQEAGLPISRRNAVALKEIADEG